MGKGFFNLFTENFWSFPTNSSFRSSSSESDWSDEEYGEERDHFVAQLYKFQDERGSESRKN